MSSFIDSAGHFHHEQAGNLALTCPHCQVLSHLTPVAMPSFTELNSQRPRHVGLICRCDSCLEPVFLRFAVRAYTSQRIELAAQYVEVERAREKFSYTYLPEHVELLCREALGTFSHGHYNAFASMCRRTMQAAFSDLGEAGKLRIFDQLNDVRAMADLDAQTFIDIKRVIFGTDADPQPGLPMLDQQLAGVLLEVLKDLLYQIYVRKGRLQQAMMMRRFFSEESLRNLGKAQPADAN